MATSFPLAFSSQLNNTGAIENMGDIFLSKFNHLQLVRRRGEWAHETGVLSRFPESFHEECVRAAKEIAQVYRGKRIFVFLSGGMDSEAVAESFVAARVSFTPLLIQYENGLNQEDFDSALRWCRSKRRNPKVVPFHLKRYFSKPATSNLAKRFRYTMPIYLILMNVMASLPADAVAILGSGEPLLIRRGSRDYLEEVWDELSLFRFATEQKRAFITHFFFWSPELYFSFITSPEYLEFLRQKGEIYRRSFPLKEKLYRREFKLAERPKRHGLEIAMKQYRDVMEKMRKTMKIKSTYVSYRRELAYLMSGLKASEMNGLEN